MDQPGPEPITQVIAADEQPVFHQSLQDALARRLAQADPTGDLARREAALLVPGQAPWRAERLRAGSPGMRASWLL